jgi:hypothetical protein
VIAYDKPNPFEVMGLPTSASERDIADRVQELYDLAETDEKRQLYRWAREAIITHPLTRLKYEVFEVPGAEYQHAQWERFEGRYGRNPIDLRALVASAGPPAVADFDLPALIEILLDGLLDVPEPDIAIVVADPPIKAGLGPLPVEVRDVIFG